MESIAWKVRNWIYIAFFVALALKACFYFAAAHEERTSKRAFSTQQIFWPPDFIPHPHPHPLPKKPQPLTPC